MLTTLILFRPFSSINLFLEECVGRSSNDLSSIDKCGKHALFIQKIMKFITVYVL